MNSKLAASIVKREEMVSEIFRGLSHPVRIRVLCLLLDGEKCVADLTDFCSITQSAMSQFLSRMKSEGLIACRREGQRMYYRIADAKLTSLLKSVKEIYCSTHKP